MSKPARRSLSARLHTFPLATRMIMRTAFTFLLLSAVNFTGFAQQIDTILYKTVDSTSLYMEIYHPTPEREDVAAPAIVFFFGGGWVGGTRGHFRDHAEYYAKKGFVCFLT